MSKVRSRVLSDTKICDLPTCRKSFDRKPGEGTNRFKRRRVCSRACVHLYRSHVSQHGHYMNRMSMDKLQEYLCLHPAYE